MDKELQLKIIEAALFTAKEPIKPESLHKLLPETADLAELLQELKQIYTNRGIELKQAAKGYFFTTIPDLAPYLIYHKQETKKLSKAAIETLSIIAYHQPITRAEIEEMRGVSLSRGTLDMLLEIGWIRPLGKRKSPGLPATWGVTDNFLTHFGLNDVGDLPGMEELRASGFASHQRELNIISMNAEADAESEKAPTPQTPTE